MTTCIEFNAKALATQGINVTSKSHQVLEQNAWHWLDTYA